MVAKQVNKKNTGKPRVLAINALDGSPDQFANDVAHIPRDTMNLIDESVDNSLDAFNDFLLACLDDHAPIKTVKIRHKPTLSSRRT